MGRSRKTERSKARNQGPADLSKAADQKIREQCSELADVLMKKALEGSATSAGLLIRLAEGADWDRSVEAGETALSRAEVWSSESQWKACASEEGAETTAGSREPE